MTRGWLQPLAWAIGSLLVVTILVLVLVSVRWWRERAKTRDRRLRMDHVKLEVHTPFPYTSVTQQTAVHDEPLYRWSTPSPLPYQELVSSCRGSMDSLCSWDDDTSSQTSLPLPGDNPEACEVPEVVEDKNSTCPGIDFSLVYAEASSTLSVLVKRVINLPLQFRRSCSSFVKVSLLARRKSSATTQVVRKSLRPQYDQGFSFPGYTLAEIRQYTLRFSVYVKRIRKNKLIGDVFYPISKADLIPDNPISCSESIQLPSKKSNSIQRSYGSLGQLLILLQYQAAAGRMKVLVRKAENLPKKGLFLRQSQHYIIVNVINGHEATTYNETRPVNGSNPVWNQPFLFDIPSSELSSYWLQFIVMRGSKYSKDGIVGHVTIGPSSTTDGTAHWNEAIQPRNQEAARWHYIRAMKQHVSG